MLKHLLKDSTVYALANVCQKLVPFLLIPVVTNYLGAQALKIYDVSFIYAYLFSWIVILGQDSAASIFYFNDKTDSDKKRVLGQGLLLQLLMLLFLAAIFLPFRISLANLLFNGDHEIRDFWLKAIWIIPAHVLLNYVLNIMIWQRKKGLYLMLCLMQVALTLGGAAWLVIFQNGTLAQLFTVIIVSTGITAVAGLWLVRSELIIDFNFKNSLAKRMAIIGLPFALTSFFHQLLPSIDRYFLIRYNYQDQLPYYSLAVKISGLLSVGVGAFAMAFTPYSLTKINEDGGEKDVSTLFRFVSAIAFLVVPLILVFKSLLITVFANAFYSKAEDLLPFLLFSWVFDLFSYFSILGVYKSGKSHLVLIFFTVGVLVISILNAVLVPRYGLQGAAASLCITKALLFFIPLVVLRKYFNVTIEAASFFIFLIASAVCSYLIYTAEFYQYTLLLALVIVAAVFYLNRLFQKNRSLLAI